MKKIRIGITTRVGNAEGYFEPRDCLAQDWANFFKEILPEVSWIMLPNIAEDITSYIQEWDINAFIISGGNDLGDEETRDKTEITIIKYAKENSLPLLGVCRGLQLLSDYFGGSLVRATDNEHPVRPHEVELIERPYDYQLPDMTIVNSFHNWLVKNSGKLTPYAQDKEGNVEGAYSKDHRIIGMGWHPERESPSADFDKQLIRSFFLKDSENRYE